MDTVEGGICVIHMDIGLQGRVISGPGKQRQQTALLELAKVGVIVYLGCQFDTHNKGVSIKNCLHQSGWWGCLWGNFLTAD